MIRTFDAPVARAEKEPGRGLRAGAAHVGAQGDQLEEQAVPDPLRGGVAAAGVVAVNDAHGHADRAGHAQIKGRGVGQMTVDDRVLGMLSVEASQEAKIERESGEAQRRSDKDLRAVFFESASDAEVGLFMHEKIEDDLFFVYCVVIAHDNAGNAAVGRELVDDLKDAERLSHVFFSHDIPLGVI